MLKLIILTIVRQFFSLIIVFSLLVLRNDVNDIIPDFCGLIKIVIFIWNCINLIKRFVTNLDKSLSFGTWIVSCIVDACFSLQMLISVVFHFQDFIENSIMELNINLILYLLFDTIINLIHLLLIVLSIKPYTVITDEPSRSFKHINTLGELRENSKTKSIKK